MAREAAKAVAREAAKAVAREATKAVAREAAKAVAREATKAVAREAAKAVAREAVQPGTRLPRAAVAHSRPRLGRHAAAEGCCGRGPSVRSSDAHHAAAENPSSPSFSSSSKAVSKPCPAKHGTRALNRKRGQGRSGGVGFNRS